MGGSSTGDVIEATATSTPAQGQGNRQQRRQSTKGKAKVGPVAELPSITDDKVPEVPFADEVPSKPAKVASTIGRGLHKVGTAVADANLRKVGKGFKALGRQIPTVSFERRDSANSDEA